MRRCTQRPSCQTGTLCEVTATTTGCGPLLRTSRLVIHTPYKDHRGRRSNVRMWRCKRGHPSGAPILKPCKFAVKPVCNRRATANRKVPGTCTREAGLDRAFGEDSGGTSRKEGQVRAPPRPAAAAYSNEPDLSDLRRHIPLWQVHIRHIYIRMLSQTAQTYQAILHQVPLVSHLPGLHPLYPETLQRQK